MLNISKVKQIMKENGLKMSYVCEKLGSSRYKMYDWERGKSTPTENEIDALADILGTTSAYLTDKTDIKEQKNKPAAKSDELDPKDRQIIELLHSLEPEKKRIALAQLKALADLSDKQ